MIDTGFIKSSADNLTGTYNMGEVDDGAATFRLDRRQLHHEGTGGAPEIDRASER